MEEVDYMSDELLCTTSDVRPGLVFSRSKQREYNIKSKKEMQKVEQYTKSSKFLETERLKEGLDKPLSSDNKGFAMLQKMGFKPGTSLGGTNSGIVEPISISVKKDRTGFGREQALRDIQLKKIQMKQKHTIVNVENFRSEKSRKYRERYLAADLFKSQKACHKFDTDDGLELPDESWFWPEIEIAEDEEQEDEETPECLDAVMEYTEEEKLELLTMYLRKTYLYCIWCGVKYDDEKDLTSSCPGPTRDDH